MNFPTSLDAAMDLFQQADVYGNPPVKWAIALGTVVGVGLALWLTKLALAQHAKKLAGKHRNDWLDAMEDLIRSTRRWFMFIVALYSGSMMLSLSEKDRWYTNKAIITVLLLQAALWGDSLVRSLFHKQVKRRTAADASSATTLVALGFLARLTIWTIAILMGMENVGINVTAIVAGLGIGGVAVALAAQNVLSDLFASASIVLDRPFVLGDFIIVGDDKGTVEYIGLKTTRVRSLSGEQLIFSNNDLLKSRIRNFKRMDERRVSFNIDIAHETPPQKVAVMPAMFRAMVEAQSRTRFSRAHFKQIGGSALTFEVVYYVLSADYDLAMDIQQAINLAIILKFSQEQISLA